MPIPLEKKISTLLLLLKEPKVFKALISLRTSGYLFTNGWFNSLKKQLPVNKDNTPIPWVTYPFIDFIESRLSSDYELFEFGTGHSTLYYSPKLKSVTAVEHDKAWYNELKKRISKNVKLILSEDESADSYLDAIRKLNKKFDIISIDGIYRVECIYESVNHLKENGVIILDDSERVEYKEGEEFLVKNGYKKIDFWGMSAGYLFKKATTVYYKMSNCLEI
jgi:hypothetical protein